MSLGSSSEKDAGLFKTHDDGLSQDPGLDTCEYFVRKMYVTVLSVAISFSFQCEPVCVCLNHDQCLSAYAWEEGWGLIWIISAALV